MEGNVDADLFASLLKELAAPPAATAQVRLVGSLDNWYKTWNDGYAGYGSTPEILSHEAGELIRMQTDGSVGDPLAAARSDVWCSWEKRGEAAKAGALEPGKCGNPFGPELVLGHFLGEKWAAPISFVKVAHGGTTLETDWLSTSAAQAHGREVGPLYEQLKTRIQSLSNDKSLLHPDCATRPLVWSAFVWFQGENDTFSPNGSTEYEANLRALISDVRGEIGVPSLPVIIVQIGHWAHTADSAGGAKVYDAQAKVVSTTPGASLVVTDDLSGFYHYDSAAQLIIGERVARALLK